MVGDFDGVLDFGFDDVYGGVEDGVDGVVDGVGDDVVCYLVLFCFGFWDELVDLEDVVKVVGVLEDVVLEGGFEVVVYGEDVFVVDCFYDDVDYVVVLVG